jgi:uncharacterized membrane protein required for colicin V production
MGVLIDVILVLIFFSAIISGIKRGLIMSVIRSLSLILAVIGAWFFYPLLSPYFYDNVISGRISADIEASINSIISGLNLDFSTLFTDQPPAFLQIFEQYGVDISPIREKYYSSMQNLDSSNVSSQIAESIAEPVSNALSNILAFICIFVAILLVLWLLSHLLDLIFKLPILKSINRIGGAVFGIITGVIGAFIAALIINSLCPALSTLFPDYISPDAADSSLLMRLILSIDFKDIINRFVAVISK